VPHLKVIQNECSTNKSEHISDDCCWRGTTIAIKLVSPEKYSDPAAAISCPLITIKDVVLYYCPPGQRLDKMFVEG
jgi:hypothetical protein